MSVYHSGGYTCYYLRTDDGGGVKYGPEAQTCRLLATSTTTAVAPCVPTTDENASQSLLAVLPYTSSITTQSQTSTSTFETLSAFAPLYVNPEIDLHDLITLRVIILNLHFRGPISHNEVTEYRSTGGLRI